MILIFFFFSSRRRHTRSKRDWSSDVCSSDLKLQANTWARNRSPNALENSGPAPFNQKQYGYSAGGPIPGSMFKDKARSEERRVGKEGRWGRWRVECKWRDERWERQGVGQETR